MECTSFELGDDANTGIAGCVCLERVMEFEMPGLDCCDDCRGFGCDGCRGIFSSEISSAGGCRDVFSSEFFSAGGVCRDSLRCVAGLLRFEEALPSFFERFGTALYPTLKGVAATFLNPVQGLLAQLLVSRELFVVSELVFLAW